MRDVVIIGAGICGSALARELSKFQLDVLVLEKENDASFGSTKEIGRASCRERVSSPV